MTVRPVVDFVREMFAKWQRDRALAQLRCARLLHVGAAPRPGDRGRGLALGGAAAEGEIVRQIEGLMGADGARMIQEMVARASRPRSSGIMATLASLAMMLGASGVFGQLQASLNDIFRAQPKTGGGYAASWRQRLAYLGMIVGIGFLLLVSLVLSAALAAVHGLLAEQWPVLAPRPPAAQLRVARRHQRALCPDLPGCFRTSISPGATCGSAPSSPRSSSPPGRP